MKSILDEIINNKLHEVAEKKKKRNFMYAIKNPKAGNISIIAEIKLVSPGEGRLGGKKDIVRRVMEYGEGGADAISLVVDKKYFNGDLALIKKIKNSVALPVLAKDFIINPYQIHEMKAYGADAILLIAKIISRENLREFVKLSFEADLEPIVEVQNREELEKATGTDTKVIAVNARDLSTFEINVDRACALLKLIPGKFTALGFSGVSNRADIQKYRKAGAMGVLVGTSLMKSSNVQGLIKELKNI